MKNTSIKPRILQKSNIGNPVYSRGLWAVVFCLFFTSSVFGQGAAKVAPPLSVDDYQKAMAFKLKNLDEDTYVKLENGYVLDRENKPYVFTYSDGVERRIYLYKMMKGANRDEVATVALYSTPKTGKIINVIIPNAQAEKKVWDLYIDDLKLQDEKEKGFLSTLAFVLSREYAQRAGGAGATTAGTSSGDYDFCFPAQAVVTMADRTHKKIAEISAGEKVMAFDLASQTTTETTVTGVQSHFRAAGYTLTTLILLPLEEITAAAAGTIASAPVEISATANHPVMTSAGRKPMGAVQEGELLFQYDRVLNQLRAYRVAETKTAATTTAQVYNLETEAGNYLINGTVVLDK